MNESGIAKAGWRTIPEQSLCEAFDDNVATVWTAKEQQKELCIDIGKVTDILSVIYTPPANISNGLITKYEIYVSQSPDKWGEIVSKGEFGNIRNNPLPQTVRFEQQMKGRYIRFVATETVENSPMTVAELDIISHKNLN